VSPANIARSISVLFNEPQPNPFSRCRCVTSLRNILVNLIYGLSFRENQGNRSRQLPSHFMNLRTPEQTPSPFRLGSCIRSGIVSPKTLNWNEFAAWSAWYYFVLIFILPTGSSSGMRIEASFREPLPMDKWDSRFCELVKFVSEWSKDPNAKVGAVVFAKRGGDVSIGYNGFPMGVEDSAERLNDQEMKLEIVVHAEQNALIAAGSRTTGSTLYVWGKPVCARCAGLIIQARVRRVVAPSPETVGVESKWYNTGEIAHQMLAEAGIEVDFYSDSMSKRCASKC
jgi:dCMP deaminase